MESDSMKVGSTMESSAMKVTCAMEEVLDDAEFATDSR